MSGIEPSTSKLHGFILLLQIKNVLINYFLKIIYKIYVTFYTQKNRDNFIFTGN